MTFRFSDKFKQKNPDVQMDPGFIEVERMVGWLNSDKPTAFTAVCKKVGGRRFEKKKKQTKENKPYRRVLAFFCNCTISYLINPSFLNPLMNLQCVNLPQSRWNGKTSASWVRIGRRLSLEAGHSQATLAKADPRLGFNLFCLCFFFFRGPPTFLQRAVIWVQNSVL